MAASQLDVLMFSFNRSFIYLFIFNTVVMFYRHIRINGTDAI